MLHEQKQKAGRRAVKTLKNLIIPPSRAAARSKAGARATKGLKKLRDAISKSKKAKGVGKAGKGTRHLKQLRKTVKAAGKAGKNLGKRKGFLKRMLTICKRHPKTCLAAGLLAGSGVLGAVYYDEIRAFMNDFVNPETLDDKYGYGSRRYVMHGTQEWRDLKGLDPLAGTHRAYLAKKQKASEGK